MNTVFTVEILDYDGYFVGVWKTLDGVKEYLKNLHPDREVVLEKSANPSNKVKNTWLFVHEVKDTEWGTFTPEIYRICESIPQ